MHMLLATTSLLSWSVESWMQHAFYPALLLVLLSASLGVPIPEDVPLIAAGVILSRHPETATWAGTLCTALLGIMCGDTVLYVLGKRWGPEVCQHRWISWLITPARLEKMTSRVNRYGMWMCFFARLFMGVRAAMCITAGVTRLPFWRFLLADLAGAVLSVPLFVWLGYWFANVVPTLQTYVHVIQWGLLGIAIVIVAGSIIYWRRRRQRVVPPTETPPSIGVTAQRSAALEDLAPAKAVKRQRAGRKAETCR